MSAYSHDFQQILLFFSSFQLAVMSEQNGSESDSSSSLQRKHIASLTHSEMIMLNLNEIQTLGRFAYDLVLAEDEENKIFAFEYEEDEDSLLLMVPNAFYHSVKNRCKAFVEMLCLCSQTITIPLAGNYYDEISSLLSTYCLNYRYKKGKNVIKFYLNSECWVSYLDFVTFQAIQFKQKNCKQLLSMKKSNSFQFCLNHFKQSVMPSIFTSEEDSIESILQTEIEKIKDIYRDLLCEQRFHLIYELMNETTSSFKQLEKEIQALILSKHITTVADEEYDTLINKQLDSLVTAELEKCRPQLKSPDFKQNEYTYMKVVFQLLQTLRENQFEVNDEKYMFITSKILQSMHEMRQEQSTELKTQNLQLARTVELQHEEIGRLNREMQELRAALEAKKKNDLFIVIEEKEGGPEVKRSTSEVQLQKDVLTIKDLKEPLQMLNFNTPNSKSTSKLASLSKTNEKKLKGTVKKRAQLK